ncbi:MAG: cache domain-containing protein [Acidobacteria bacterium]|nr:cache domain-containing protein [Acidobacteriota bacterium]
MNSTTQKSKLRIDFRTFFILTLVAVIPVLVGIWWLFRSFEDAYLERVGTNLSEIADTAFRSVDVYLQNQIIATAALAEVPTLTDIVSRANLDLTRDLEEVRRSIPRDEAAWGGMDRRAPRVRAILDNPASEFLRRYIAVDKYYREIIVTDFFGRLVAGTEKPSKYYYALEEWWRETYGDGGRGSVFVGNVRYDAGTRSYLLDMAQPFVSGGSVVGVLKVVLDTQPIHSLVGSIQSGPGAVVALIHARGDIISAPGYSSLEVRTYPATLDILNARDRGKRFFVSTDDPRSVYGLSQRGFAEIYPHLNWLVVASGNVRDLVGPLPQLRKYLMALFLGVILLAVVATLMLSQVESKPVIEEDPHLERL